MAESHITTQREILMRIADRLRAKVGPDAPCVRGLEAQIAAIDKPRSENPHDSRVGGDEREA